MGTDYRSKYMKKYVGVSDEEEKKEQPRQEQPKQTSSSSGSKSTVDYRSKYMKKYVEDTVDLDGVNKWYNEATMVIGRLGSNDSSKYTTDFGGDDYKKAASLLDSYKDVWKYFYNHKDEFENFDEIDDAFSRVRNALRGLYNQTGDVRRYYNQWDSEEAYETALAEWQDYYDRWGHYADEADFDTWSSKGASIVNPTVEEAENAGYFFGKRIGGADVGNIVTYSRDNWEKLAMGEANGSHLQGRSLYHYMTDDEVGIYNYLLAKQGNEAAQSFLDDLEESLNYRMGTGQAERFTGIDNDIARTAALGLYGVGAGVDQWASGVRQIVSNEKQPTSATQFGSSQIAESLDGLGGYAYQATTTVGNMAPSILVSSLFGAAGASATAAHIAGAATMGTSAAGNAYGQAMADGYSEGQARAYSTLVGASEATLQYLLGGISKLGGMSGKVAGAVANIDNTLLRVAAKFGTSISSEIVEEGLQAFLEPAFRTIIFDEVYDAPTMEELIETAIVTALSTGTLEGGGIVGAEVNDLSAYKGDAEALLSMGRESENAELKALAEELTGAKLTNRQARNLDQAITGADVDTIAKAAEQRLTELGETGDVAAISRAIAKTVATQATGGQYSKISPAKSETALISGSKYGQRVMNELDPMNIASQSYSSDWTESIGTKRINSLLYNLASEVSGADASVEGNNTPVVETASSGALSVSDDGMTTIEDSDGNAREIHIESIASIQNGEATFTLDDGSTVKASDVSFGSQDEALVYEAVANLGGIIDTDTANRLSKHLLKLGGASSNVYVKGIVQAYTYGYYGYGREAMAGENTLSSTLTEKQRNVAYGLGEKYREVKVAADQAKATVAKTAKVQKGKKAAGKVHFERNGRTFNEKQEVGLQTMEKLSAALGVEFYVYESYVDASGRRVMKNASGNVVPAPNGWYDPTDGSIHIDLNAGKGGEGTILFTVSHELAHYIKDRAPAKYKKFASFLVEQYGKTGQSVDELVQAQIAKAKRNGRDISYDVAFDEVVADSCETMLSSGRVMETMAQLKQQDKSLWEKICEFFKDLVEHLKAVVDTYGNLTPDSVEGRLVADMKDVIQDLESIYTEALVDAGTSEQVLAESGIAVDSKTDAGSIYSVRDVLDEKDRKKVATALAERFEVTQAEAMDWLKAETSLASLILNPKYSAYLDYEGDPNETAIKQNSDYPQGTVDFSNICKKRREFTQVMNSVMRNFPNHIFAATDLAKIRTIMGEEGMTLPCGICYVEDRRQLDTIVAQDFVEGLKLYREGSTTRPDGKPFNANQLKGLQLTDGDTYVPSIYELVTLEGRNSLKAKNPNMEAAWVKYNNARGMQSVRLLTNEAEYKRQILKYSPKTVQRKNDHGGLRIYSFSDMEMFHLIDIVQVITDCAAKGLYLQGYTKVNEYARAVKDTGEKLNRSLIPLGDLGYHMEDGEVILDYDTVEGIDITSEDFFDNRDNPNVGNITIGINDTQIRAAMVSDFVDQIIPFHAGQSEEVLGEKGIAAWENYKDFQTEKDLATGRTASHQVNIYTEVFQAAEEEGNPIRNKRQFVEKFLEVCKKHGLKPRFAQFLNTDAQGNYIYTEGYHKFLVDFKTFAQTEVGEYLPQGPVRPIFDDAYITGLLKAYVKEQKAKDATVAKSMPKVIERITEEIINPGAEAEVKLSDRDYSYAALVSKPDMPVTMVGGNVPGNRADVVVQAKKNAAKVGKFDPKTGSVSVHVKDIDGDVIIGRDGLKHSLDRRFEVNAPVVLKAGEILANSIRINEMTPKKVGANESYVLIGAARNAANELYVVRSVVNRFSNELTSMDVLYAINAKKKPAALLPLSTGKPALGTDSTISIANLLDYVNQYFPDVLPEDVLKHYGHTSRPAGELGDRVLYSDRDPAADGAFVYSIQLNQNKKIKASPPLSSLLRASSGVTNASGDMVAHSDPKVKSSDRDTVDSASLINENNIIRIRDDKDGDSMKRLERDSDGNSLTAAQSAFFAHSKVRDEDGNLLKVYHGTPNRFTTFQQGVADGWGKGIYFTDNRAEAETYGKNIVEVYLNITNPFNADTMSYDEIDAENTQAYRDFDMKRWKKWYDGYDTYEEYRADGLGADMADIYSESVDVFNQILRELGYDGIIANGSNGINGMEIVAFSSEQVKSVDNKTPTYDPDIRYQERAEDSVSNRSLLAGALETVAKNDVERRRIAEYQEKVGLINAEERKLHELNEQIKELSFAKGPKDTKKIRDLQFEARQTANRINTYDRQLLRLEASAPLQAVLDREKKLAYKKAKQEGKEALAAYRERAAKTQQELLTRYQEARHRSVESRNKTAMRHKIKDVVGELNKLLLHGTKDKHVMIGLQKAVAEALDAVNMDTVGAEERVAKYNALIAKATDPDVIASLTATRDRIQEQGDKLGDKLQRLKASYGDIKNSDDPLIANSYDEVIANRIETVTAQVGDTPLRAMTLDQLEAVYDMYKMVLTTIRNSNKAFKAAKNETISTLGNRVMEEIEEVGGSSPYSLKGAEGVKSFAWNGLKPVYAFKAIGSKTLSDTFDTVRSGEDTWAKDVTEAKAFFTQMAKKYGYHSWDFKRQFKFTSTTGREFSLSLEQILSLYAYSKREQADLHLEKGGFVFDSAIEVVEKKKGIPVKYTVKTATAHNLSKDILAAITGTLTEAQRGFVDEMQTYLSETMGEKGNEVSLEMYGVKLFKEKAYFPLKSAKQFMFEQNEAAGEVRIKNAGFSKETVAFAANPIILSNFMDVWANHVNDMSMYHAFVLPLEDFNRIFNYKTPNVENLDTESVKMYLQNAYGTQPEKYIKQLLTDLNGGARTDSTAGIINKGIAAFKKGAVFASLSVVIQQPSAIARALAYVDAKYFIGKRSMKKHEALWAEVKKYAPVAIIKEMGYFDTNMGMSTVDFITAREYSHWGEKMKALVTDSNYRDEILSKAPALADELAWTSIWEAVKRETAAKHKGLQKGSEAFLQMAGERFTEVIVNTQVYDSVLSRSAMMRSKDTGMKMATAFMAEPTTTINMVADALIQGKRGRKKFARAAIGAAIASQILNSILVSFVYAGRDDDEEKSYWEKYLGTLVGEIKDSFNIFGYIPFVKDIVSIVQGYDVERSDMAVISDLWNAYEQLGSDSISTYRKVENFAGSIAQIFGLPVKNIMRDVRGIYQTVDSFMNGELTTKAGILYAVKEGLTGETVSKQQQLYEAYLSGDKAQIARVEGRYEDQTAINSAIRKALRENDSRIHEAAVARMNGDIAGYTKIAKEIIGEGIFSQDNVVAAINAEINAMGKDEDSSSSGSKKLSLYNSDDFVAAILDGDEALANTVKTDIIQTAVKNGKAQADAESSFESSARTACKEAFLAGNLSETKTIDALVDFCGNTQEEADKKVGEWAFEAEYGFSWSDRGTAYKNGEISADELISVLMEVGGKTWEDADLQVQIYDWQMEVPECDDITASAIEDYNSYCAPVGISKSDYYDAWTTYKDTPADYDDAGDSIPYSKTVKVMPYINSLPLSADQKTALALCWWSQSTVNKYRLW